MKVSIIGAAGIVGSCTAFAIADQGLADEIVMLDTKQNAVTNHAMDIHAAMTGLKNISVHTGIYEDMAASDIVIIAAGIHFPAVAPVPEKLAPNIPIIKSLAANIERYCPQAVVITATNPVDLLNYAVYLSTSLERKKLIGFNLNDSTRFRMSLAKALGIPSTSVEGLVVGEHPKAPLLLFSSVKVNGKPFSVTETVKQKVQQELHSYLSSLEALNAGRSAGWTSATGLATIVRAIVEDSGKILACSAVLEGEYGYKGLSIGVPAVIGKRGIHQILEWALTSTERQEMDSIAHVLEENSLLVRQLVGSQRR